MPHMLQIVGWFTVITGYMVFLCWARAIITTGKFDKSEKIFLAFSLSLILLGHILALIGVTLS